jgi:pimeloyl-ACP methyl ester carboxylesterase
MSALPAIKFGVRKLSWRGHSIWPVRWLLATAVGVAGLLNGGQISSGQDDKKSEKPIQVKSIQSLDGWPLKLTYYRSSQGKSAAVVILLHGKNESRMVWTAKDGFAEQLQGQGFAVIALDLRKHGQSKPGETDSDTATKKDDKSAKKSTSSELKRDDYVGMVADLEAVKKFIFEEHQKGNLNMRKTAIVAPTMSASVALVFTERDWNRIPYDDAPTKAQCTPRGQDVQALVFLSPETNVAGLQVHQVAPNLRNFPLTSFVLVGKTDPLDKGQAEKLVQQLGGDVPKTTGAKKTETKKGKDKNSESSKEENKRHVFGQLPGSLRGTDLLGNKKLETEKYMLLFLKEHVQDLDGPFYDWRDRKSPLSD